MRESEAKLRCIAESGMVGLFYWTVARDIADANDEFLRMLGYTREDLQTGQLNGRRLTPARWEAKDNEKIAEVLRTGRASWEKEFYARDGHCVPVLVAKALLEGSADNGIAICLDISERKRSESERERLLLRERDARAGAERATRLRDEMLALIVHDLRNPVNTIGMTAEMLRAFDAGDQTRAHYIDVIERAASDMSHLINDLLDVSRFESGTFAIAVSSVQIRELLGQTIDGFEAQAGSAGVRLVREIAPEVAAVAGDRDRLMQVLSNLVSNALKFMSGAGSIVLRATRTDGYVEVSVADTGPGLPVGSLPHVFDRFWQADHASRAGSGLGLCICKGIIEAHGGRIWVESTVGAGTTFHFTLPCVDEPSIAPPAAMPAVAESGP
ncbi:MAG: ATP-binding protein [Longimicrobiales bacterium]